MELIYGLMLMLTAPLLCTASVDCSNVDGFIPTPEGMNAYVTHSYSATSNTGDCLTVTQNCFATFDPSSLDKRTWYITNTRTASGTAYKSNWIQNFNIQCPENNVLHLFPQMLDTEAAPNGACLGQDTVVVNVPGEFTDEFCGNDEARRATDLYNFGAGRIFTGGNATVSFCSNGNMVNGTGFVVRASCVDPRFSLLPECADYNQVRGTPLGSRFIDRIFKPFATPMPTNILHKRSLDLADLPRKQARILELMLSGKIRQKRFVNGDFITFDLDSDTTITYSDSKLEVDFNNGSSPQTFDVAWLVTNSDLLGTRIFDVQLPSTLETLRGPGSVDIFDGLAIVKYTITEDMIEELLITNVEISDIINRIADYTFNNFIRPYPVTCPVGVDPLAFPIPSAEDTEGDPRFRNLDSLDFIQEEVNGTCSRHVRIEIAPSRRASIEANILDFCRFFTGSCNAMLANACREITGLLR